MNIEIGQIKDYRGIVVTTTLEPNASVLVVTVESDPSLRMQTPRNTFLISNAHSIDPQRLSQKLVKYINEYYRKYMHHKFN